MLSDDTTVRIPLRARDGSVKAYALIDAIDADFINQWRWSLSKGYAERVAYRNGSPTTYRMNREILGLIHGDDRQGDHISRDRLDNRRSNLRVIPKNAQSQNQPSHRNSSSQFRGVSWMGRLQKWRAEITVDGKRHYLGLFISETDAAEAARAARKKFMPYAMD